MNDCVRPEDILVIPGNSAPSIAWQFLISENPDVLFTLTGSDFYLTLKWPGGNVHGANTIDNPDELVVDVTKAMVIWTYDLSVSRLFPQGRIARYELERWIGNTQQTFIAGHVVVPQSINTDQSISDVFVDDGDQILEDDSANALTP